MSAGTKRGFGCLGCLGRTALALALGVLLILLITAVFDPWAFYLGGHFHVLPYWQGWGRLHSNVAGGDYVVFVRIEPWRGRGRGGAYVLSTHLTGTGYICTPRGERFYMHVSGGMRKHLNVSTDGEAISLGMDNWSSLFSSFSGEHRPTIGFRGRWQNPNLVMDDHGSISNAFEPDGSVYQGHQPNRPYSREVVPIRFVAGSYSDFKSACQALHR